MTELHEQERVSWNTWRLAVPGGWVYIIGEKADSGSPLRMTSTFVPDRHAEHNRRLKQFNRAQLRPEAGAS